MWLLDLVAIICVLAGICVIWLGFELGKTELQLRKAVESASKSLNLGRTPKKSPAGSSGGLADTAEPQALLPDVAETTKALAELAKALKGLSPAVQAFLVSIVFFLISAALAALSVFGPH